MWLLLIDLFHDVAENEYLFGCAPILTKTTTLYSVLDPVDNDSPYYFVAYR